MDRYEVAVKVEEIIKYASVRQYDKACELLETINTDKIKNYDDLITFAEVYLKSKKYIEAKAILERVHERTVTRRLIALMISVTAKMHNYVEAEKYYEEYVEMAPKDVNRFILRYKIDKAKGLSYDVLIKSLEQLKEFDLIEEWEYELAKLYHKAGYYDKCISECNTIIMMFGAGVTVEKAKMLRDHHIEAISKSSKLPLGEQAGGDSEFNATVELNQIIDQVKEKMAEEEKQDSKDIEVESSDEEDYGENMSISAKIEEEYAKDNDKITDEFLKQEEKKANAQEVLEIVDNDSKTKTEESADKENSDITISEKDNSQEIKSEEIKSEKEVSDNSEEKTEEKPDEEDFFSDLSNLFSNEVDKIFEEAKQEAMDVNPQSSLGKEIAGVQDAEKENAMSADDTEQSDVNIEDEENDDLEEADNIDFEDMDDEADEATQEKVTSKKKERRFADINPFKEVFVKKKDEPFKRREERFDFMLDDDEEEDENFLEFEAIIKREEERKAALRASEADDKELTTVIEDNKDYLNLDDKTEAMLDTALNLEEAKAVGKALSKINTVTTPEKTIAAIEDGLSAIEDRPNEQLTLFDLSLEVPAGSVDENKLVGDTFKAEEEIEEAVKEEAKEETEEVAEEVAEDKEAVKEEATVEAEEEFKEEIVAEAEAEEVDEEVDEEPTVEFTTEEVTAVEAKIEEAIEEVEVDEESVQPVNDSADRIESVSERTIMPDYNNSGMGSEELDEDEYNHVMQWLKVLMSPMMYDASKTEDIDANVFRNYYDISFLRNNIRCALNTLASSAVKGNFIICGQEKSGRTTVAKMIAKAAYTKDLVETSKIARIDADKFNVVDLEYKQEKLADGCLIIQKAHLLTPAAMTSLITMIIHLNGRIVVFLETDYDNITRLYTMTREVRDYFSNIVSLPEYNKEELMGFAKSYAAYKNYSFNQTGEFAMEELIEKSYNQLEPEQRIPFVLTAVEKSIRAAINRSKGGFGKPNSDGLNELDMQDVEQQYQ